jgi:two-component system, chemotaxis family, CheB/CheR fusion protein
VDVIIGATQLFLEDGDVRGSIAAILDISERKQAEAAQQALVYELQHRVKNIIATVGALAGHTLRDDLSARAFVQAFVGRLQGMASTQELLARADWRGTSLACLVETVLQENFLPNVGKIAIGGPEIQMMPNAATTLGMIFYELTINALTFGAQSRAEGNMEVTWRTVAEPAPGILLTWTESGGRPLDRDAASGFGTNFVRRSIEYELRGRATLEPTSDGLRWNLEFPFT